MKILDWFLLSILAALMLAGCGGKNSSQSTSGTNAAAAFGGSNSLDYLGGLVQAKKYADKTIDVSYLNQAVQQFNVQEGRYPKTLEELTPNYVAKIPDAPIGYQIEYDAARGDVKVVKQ